MNQNPSSLMLRPVLLLCLVLFASIAVFASPGARAETTYLGSWGAPGNGDGQFDTPMDVAVAPGSEGQVYVVDRGNFRIQRFSTDGQFLGKWGSAGTGDGQFGASLVAVAVAPDGKVFVLDDRGSGSGFRVQRFDADGTFELGWGPAEGSALGEFDEPRDIAVGPSGRVYVLDAGNHRVQSFDSDGSNPAAWGSVGNSGEGQFAAPVGIAVDAISGDVYVADNGGTPRVQAFSAAGNFITEWGSTGSAEGQFPAHGLVSIAIGAAGEVYTRELLSYEPGANRFQRFTPTGEFVAAQSWSGLVEPHGLAVGEEALFAPDTTGGEIQVIYLRRLLVSLLAPYLSVGVGEKTVFQATAIAPFGQATHHEWDLDGNGVYEQDTGPFPEAHHTYSQVGHYTARLRVTSEFGGVGTDERKVEVVIPPPSGPVGVSINDGARYTRDPDVTVTVRWPRWREWLKIANDGGFVPAGSMPVQEKISWRLDTRGPQQHPRTIYVRFGWSTFEEQTTYTDDIYLDMVKPTVKVTEVPVTSGPVRLELKARDKVSGVVGMQLMRKGKRQAWRRFSNSLRLGGSAKGVRVRVRDRAGNHSRWVRVRPR